MEKKSKDKGLEIALIAGNASPNPLARKAVSGYNLYKEIGVKSEYDDWTKGEVPVGFIIDKSAPKGTILKLLLKSLVRNMIIAGRSGSGKTHLCMVLISAIMKYIKVMIFDRLSDYKEAFKNRDVLIFPIEHLRINPLFAPKGVPDDKWLEYFSATFVSSLILTDVGRGNLIYLIKYARKKFSSNKYGLSLYELKLAIGDLKIKHKKEYQRLTYLTRLEDRIDNVLYGPLGSIFSSYTDHDLETLLSKNIIFDISGLSSHAVRILVSIIMIKIFCYRLFNNQGGEPLHATVLEEAEDVFGNKYSGIIENPMDDVARRIRGRGECMIVLNQSYKDLSRALRTNTFTHFMLGMSRPDERVELGKAMGIRDSQWEDVFSLDQPYAFVSVEGREPVLIQIPAYHTTDSPIDSKKIVHSPDHFPYIPVPDSVISKAINIIGKQTVLTLQEVKDTKEVLDNKKVLELLLNIANDPFIPFSLRKNLSFSKSKNELFRIMTLACDQQLVRKVKVKMKSGRGQPALFLELLEDGLELIKESHNWKGNSYFHGKMSFFGSLLLHRLIEPYYMDLGYQTFVEGFLKGADCDLGVMGDNDTLDITVELSVTTDAAQEMRNIRRNIKAGWSQTIIVVSSFEEKNGEIVESDEQTMKKLESFVRYFSKNLSIEENKTVEVRSIKEFRSDK